MPASIMTSTVAMGKVMFAFVPESMLDEVEGTVNKVYGEHQYRPGELEDELKEIRKSTRARSRGV